MNSDDASALFLAGTACFQLRDLPAAEDWLKQAAVLAPDVAEIHSNLGMVQGARGRHDDAIESFRRALVLRPDFAEAFNNLGEALWRLGRRQEAIDAYRQAIGIDPGLAAAQNNLGVTLREDSHTATAEAAFRAALDSDPAFGDAHSNLCSLLLELRRPVAALAAGPTASISRSRTAGMPSPLAPDNRKISALLARFSLVAIFLSSAGSTASILLSPMTSAFSVRSAP